MATALAVTAAASAELRSVSSSVSERQIASQAALGSSSRAMTRYSAGSAAAAATSRPAT